MSLAVQILTIIGVPALISGIVLIVINRSLKKRDAKQEEIRKQNLEMERQNKAIMLGVQAILRDRLLQGYRHYIDKGFAEYDDRENMENIYAQYHALGANGVMDDMRDKFRSLPMSAS
ncbi:MAG: hypothetical protein J6Y26_05645 [Lachnospiraceae bacterium]|nr:hypothetical protein [Lachnospiraceae bacterium]